MIATSEFLLKVFVLFGTEGIAVLLCIQEVLGSKLGLADRPC
jgi:hypothetical protein